MPRKKDAVVLGRCPCEGCGKRAAVFQNVRGYLYTRCDDCGADQRNGIKPQTYMWSNSEWIGNAPEKPRNVPDVQPEPVPAEPVQKPVHEPIGDAPEIEGDWQPAGEDEKSGGGSGVFIVGAVVLGLLGALAGVSR
jgi:predicted nucleic acid-binding Zn ribbon protein